MADTRIKVILDLDSDISKAKSSISELSQAFSNIGGAKGNALTNTLQQIEKEFDKLQSISGNAMSKIGDFSKAESSTLKIDGLIKKLSKELTDMGAISQDQAKKMFPPTILANINKVSSAIKTYKAEMKKSETGPIKEATREFEKQEKEIKKLTEDLQKYEKLKSSKILVSKESYNVAKNTAKTKEDEATNAQGEVERLKAQRQAAIDEYNTKTGKNTGVYSKDAKTLSAQIKAAQEHANKLAKDAKEAQDYFDNITIGETLNNNIAETKKLLEEATKKSQDLQNNLNNVKAEAVTAAFDKAKKSLEGMTGVDLSKITNIEQLNQLFEKFNQEGLESFKKGVLDATGSLEQLEGANKNMGNSIDENKSKIEEENRALSNVEGLKSRIQYFFSLTNTVQLARRALRQAINTIKELDAAMTETAVVTDFDVGDMWEQLPRYTEAANKLGTTTLGAYQTMTLFYQQGLETNEVFEIGTETMKMARIAGLEYSDATNLMTAALRGFNMELNETSAQRVNDVYSELAAITAADTEEIATAMTKTASIAANANMEFETTAALLAQIIETTREPAETAGTAMKTIIARFTEMKKATSDIVSVDGEEVSVNKVEAALKSAGVALRDVNGEFRNLDDVFLELSSKWNSLDMMTQRYVATMAAGSRQQSRFIAMMSDYDRTLELVDAAYNSSGASQKQFEKTQESLESKINKLTNAWNEFLMGISNSTVIKGAVDLLTGVLNVVNKLTGAFGEGIGGILKFGVALGTLKVGSTVLNKGLKKAASFALSFQKNKGNSNPNFVQRLTQKVNNFTSGKAFVIDADINTKGIENKINNIKTQWSDLRTSLTKKVEIKGDPSKAILSFTTLDGAMAASAITSKVTSETIEVGLSEVGTKAILAAQGIDESSDEITEFGVEGTVALEVLTKKYDELIAKAALYDAISKDETGQYAPGMKWIAEKKKAEVDNEIFQISGDISGIKKQAEDVGTKTENAFLNRMKETGSKVGTLITTGLSKFAKLFHASGAVAGGAIAAGILAAIGGVATAIYLTWKNSSEQVAKRIAETDATTLKRTQEEIETLKTKIEEVDSTWQKLTEHQDNMEGLIQGTNNWKQEVIALKNEIQEILDKYPELYKYLQIDKQTGAWTLEKQGIEEYKTVLQKELDAKETDEYFWKMVSDSSSGKYETTKKAAKGDFLNNWLYTEEEIEDQYEQTLRKAYAKAHGQNFSDANQLINYSKDVSLEDILNDKETIKYINNLTDSSATGNFWFSGKGHADPRNALQYYQNMENVREIGMKQSDAFIRDYLSTTDYSETIQEAVANTFDMDENNLYDKIYKDRKKRNFDGGTGGKGIKMQGTGSEQEPTVQSILEDMGYELIDETRNIYENKTTGEVLNVDKVGNKKQEKKKQKINGEEREVYQVSDEYVRDLGRTKAIRTKTVSDMNILAQAYANNENLAKVVSGDLSAKIDGAKDWENITDENNKVLLDVKSVVDNFEITRSNTMKNLNAKYGGVFSSKGEKNINGEQIDIYSDQMYEIAQATTQFEKSVSGLGNNTAQVLTSTFLALQDLENQSVDLNTIIDELGTTGGDSLDEVAAQASNLASSLRESGVSAQGLQNFVNKLDMNSAINGARQLKRALDEGGQSAAYANAVIMADVDGFYRVGNQFKEMISNEDWADTQKSLTEIYNLTGDISADNIRELAEKSSDLAAILETNSLKASGFAEMMKAVEEGTINLTDVTSDLIKIYDSLYYSADLAGEAIARLEKVKIGESDTKIGKIYSESWEAVQDLIRRGAYGDSQIDDYMNQMIGPTAWTNALSAADGDKTEAVKAVDQIYGLSANQGNLYGSWVSQLENLDGQVAGGAISLGADGILNYDLSKVGSTQELIDQMVSEMGIKEEYANTLLADMKTYSKTFASDLDDLDKRGTLDSFLDSRVTEDGVLNISEAEKAAFAKSRGQTIQEFEKDMLNLKTKIITSFEDRKYSDSGYYYTTEDATTGETKATFTDDTAKQQIKNKVTQAATELENQGVSLTVEVEGSDGTELNQEYLNKLLQIDEVREIVLDPNLSDDQKTELLNEITADIGDGIAEGLLGEESLANAAGYADYLGTQMYNSLGGYLTEAISLLADYEISIPVSFGLGQITIPSNKLTQLLGVAGTTIPILGTGGMLRIGGNQAYGTASVTSSSGGGFTPKTSSYTPKTVDVDAGGNGNGGRGNSYEEKDDEDNDTTDKGGGGSDQKEVEKRNYASDNADKQLEALDRVRETNDREAELIEKLPEEIQFPLKMANLGEDMLYEYQEIQINKNKQAALQNQLDAEEKQAKYLGEYYYYDEFTDAYMYDVEKMASDDLDDEKRQEIEEEISNLQEINDKLNAVEDELDGGKIQKVFRTLEKATDGASKALKKEAKAADLLEEEFGDLAKQFGLDDELKKFGDSIDNTIKSSKLLNKSFEGLGIVSDETLSKLDKLPIGDNTKNLIKNTLGKNEGGTIGSVMGDMFGASSDMFGSIGDILNFDMMSMGLDGMNMMKDMGQKMIQYVVQFVQTIINWWINREDWLYNLLSAIEQEVRNFNRQSEVEERFRLYSDEGLNDLVSAWEAMRASLEKQIDLNEQLIESRQAELQFLNMTNLPFAPAFYYDYAEERVIENPWVYDIYVLLLDLGSAIPEFGQIFSSIKQLMEDNKKRMEDAVQEIEDARDKILELEKQQLELRTKYMEDEIELEELVMDTIIEKQQEQIDELSTMNEAIEQGNEKLIQTLNDNLDRIRQQRENQDKEEELAEKERRLAYLRQDTSNANRAEIMNLQEELKDERRDYTDELIDQKISELEKQNELAAEQRQKQIDLLQSQLDYTEKYGLQWAEAQTLIKNGFDSEGRLRVGTDLYNMLMSKEDFTSMGLGSTRQTQQIMDWNVTSIAAAAFREINDIWEEGFGNFEMSNDVHDQSRLHLWEDRQVDYYQLPSWLSFLQPAANTIQDYLWRTGNNISAFVETGFLSGKNSSSILGKTVVPLLQGIYKAVVGRVDEYNSLNEAETGGFEEVSGAITQASDNLGYGLGEKLVNGISNAFANVGGDIVNGFTNSMSNYAVPKTQTQTTGNFNMNFYINSEDREEGMSIGESVLKAFREGISNLSIFG